LTNTGAKITLMIAVIMLYIHWSQTINEWQVHERGSGKRVPFADVFDAFRYVDEHSPTPLPVLEISPLPEGDDDDDDDARGV
jgi:hypothetical protein